jgi:hypothetical protein
MTSIALRRRRAALLSDTSALTKAQATAMEVEIATNPIAQADPEAAASIAAAFGFPVFSEKPRPGLAAALAHHDRR